jgi:anti-sigma B factor antagonist
MAVSGLQLEVRDDEQAVVIVARGELDVTSSERFAAELRRASQSQLPLTVVDLSGLQFIDSSGLAALAKAHQEAKAAGRRLVVVRGPRQVQQLLELTGLSERLELIGSLGELPLAG